MARDPTQRSGHANSSAYTDLHTLIACNTCTKPPCPLVSRRTDGVGICHNVSLQKCLLASAPKLLPEDDSMKSIGRREFVQLSAVAAATGLTTYSRTSFASDLPQLSEADAMAESMKYTHDATTVDASSRPNAAADQTCDNCALVQGNDGDTWRPCQIFPGKSVNAKGWCMVWAPKS